MYRGGVRPLYLILVVLGCSKTEPARSVPTGGWVEVDPDKPLAAQLAAEAKAAAKSGKKPHAYLHAAWCPPCVEIEKTRLVDPTMQAAFATTHIIAIDVDDIDVQQLTAAGMNTKVIPIFYRLDDKGVPVGTSIDGGAWGDNIPAKMAPPLTAYFTK